MENLRERQDLQESIYEGVEPEEQDDEIEDLEEFFLEDEISHYLDGCRGKLIEIGFEGLNRIGILDDYQISDPSSFSAPDEAEVSTIILILKWGSDRSTIMWTPDINIRVIDTIPKDPGWGPAAS